MNDEHNDHFNRTIETLQAVEFPQRWREAHGMSLSPFKLDKKHKNIANPANLALFITLSRPEKRMLAGRIRTSLGWEMVRIKAVLSWGVRQGFLNQITTNVYEQAATVEEVMMWKPAKR